MARSMTSGNEQPRGECTQSSAASIRRLMASTQMMQTAHREEVLFKQPMTRHRTQDDLQHRRSVAWLRSAGPFQLGRRVRFTGSDREFPRFAVRSATQRARACFGEHLIRSKIPAVHTSPWLSDRPACTGRWRLPDPAPSGVVHVRCSAIPLARSAREWRRRPGRCHRAPCQPEADLRLISSARQPDPMSASLSALGTDRPPGCEPLSVAAKMRRVGPAAGGIAAASAVTDSASHPNRAEV